MSITPRTARVRKRLAALAVAVTGGGLLLIAPAIAEATPINISPPVINGTLEVGQTLSATTGTWTDTSPITEYWYQWQRCLASGGEEECTDLEGTGTHTSTFTIPWELLGDQIDVVVTAVDEEGEITGASSEETFIVTYDGPRYTVSEGVTGSGIVRGLAGGRADSTLLCASQCESYPYVPGTSIELVAEPDLGATFLGWGGGACAGTTPTCSFTASADTSVSARFTSLPVPTPPLEAGSGQGASGSTSGAPALGWVPALGGEAAPPGGRTPARLVSLRARRGHVEVIAACERARACHLSLAVLLGRRTLARHAFVVPAWSSVGVSLTLDGAGARLLARHHRLPVTARLALSTGGRSTTVASRRLTVTS